MWYQLLPSYRRANKTSGRPLAFLQLPAAPCLCCLSLCQPLPLQRPGESEERDAGRERKELGVPLRDIRLRIVCQREDMWRGSRGAGCSTSANPRRHVPRRAAMVRATYSQHTGRPGHRQTKLQSPAGGGRDRSGSGSGPLNFLWSLLGEPILSCPRSKVWSETKPRNSACNKIAALVPCSGAGID